MMTEESRNAEINKNNERILKGIKSLQKKLQQGEGAILFGSINTILKEIEKIHINRVKEILIKALN